MHFSFPLLAIRWRLQPGIALAAICAAELREVVLHHPEQPCRHVKLNFLQLFLQPTKQGKRRASAHKPSEKELQLSGLLYIMYLLANDEVFHHIMV